MSDADFNSSDASQQALPKPQRVLPVLNYQSPRGNPTEPSRKFLGTMLGLWALLMTIGCGLATFGATVVRVRLVDPGRIAAGEDVLPRLAPRRSARLVRGLPGEWTIARRANMRSSRLRRPALA